MTRVLGGAAVALVLLACAPRPLPAPQPRTPRPQAPLLNVRSLPDYVPAAGLRWMIVGRPREIAGDPEVLRALGRLLPESRLQGFAQRRGFDLRSVEEAVIAGFDYGTLYLVAIAGEQGATARSFEGMLDREVVARHPHPRLKALSGTVDGVPQSLLLLRGELAAFAVGDPQLARIVEAYALGRLRSPSALEGAALSSLPRDERAPARFLVPGPFDGEWGAGAGGVLAASSAAVVALEQVNRERAVIAVRLARSSDEARAGERLRSAWDELAASPLGHVLGLDRPLAVPTVRARPGLLELRVELALEPMLQGLYALVAADVSEIMDLPALQSPVPPASVPF